MNFSIENPLNEKYLTNWKQQKFEKEIGNWNKRQGKFEKVKIQIEFTKDHQVKYSKDGSILRIEKIHDVINYPDLFNNMDQIVNLYWRGQQGLNKTKNGKWIAFWNEEDILKNVGGYYQDGQKQGFWKDLFQNFWNQCQVFETGEYQNGFRVGNWNYICYYQKIGGGLHNQYGQKQGKWAEIDEGFCNKKQIIYHGEYDIKGKKIGKWDIVFNFKDNKQIGGGQYDQEGGEKKIGLWIELDDQFNQHRQVTYFGEYNLNGNKVGQWDIILQDQMMQT